MSTELYDIKGDESNCCGAPVYTDMGICSDCKEHCSTIEEQREMDIAELKERQDALAYATEEAFEVAKRIRKIERDIAILIKQIAD